MHLAGIIYLHDFDTDPAEEQLKVLKNAIARFESTKFVLNNFKSNNPAAVGKIPRLWKSLFNENIPNPRTNPGEGEPETIVGYILENRSKDGFEALNLWHQSRGELSRRK
jgi:hypothetical protein